MADSDSSEEDSIHRLADVPILRYADPRDPNAIYTFLGLATLPRLRPGTPLRLLPREMVLKIARFAQHGYRAGWEGVGRSGQLADAVDVSNGQLEFERTELQRLLQRVQAFGAQTGSRHPLA